MATFKLSANACPLPHTLLNDQRPVKQSDQERARINDLTTREREIIGLIGEGLKNKDIADRLCISEITVRHHLTNIYGKLDVSNRQKLLILGPPVWTR